MSGIDPIKFNLHNKIQKKDQEQKKETKHEEAGKPDVQHKNPDEIMDFMNTFGALNAQGIQKQGKVDVKVSIEEAMKSFEAEVGKGLLAIEQEFGGAFSESDALAVAAEMALKSEFE